WMQGEPGREYDVEYRIIRPDGEIRWIHDRGDRILDGRGRVTRVQGVAEDVTDRRRAEEAIPANEEKNRTLIETTDTGFCVVDDQGRILDANENYLRLTGRASQADIRGRCVLEWTAPHDLERNAEEVRKCAESGRVRQLEIDYVQPSAQIVP